MLVTEEDDSVERERRRTVFNRSEDMSLDRDAVFADAEEKDAGAARSCSASKRVAFVGDEMLAT